MSAWILLLLAAARAEEPLYAGLPLDAPEALGLQAPTLSRAVDEVRIPFDGGGFVVLSVAPSIALAEVAFDGRARTSATRWPPTAEGLPGDRAIGDGGLLLVRARNAVLLVRDPSGRAAEVAARLIAALTEDPARCAPILREEVEADGAVIRWDRCGRRQP